MVGEERSDRGVSYRRPTTPTIEIDQLHRPRAVNTAYEREYPSCDLSQNLPNHNSKDKTSSSIDSVLRHDLTVEAKKQYQEDHGARQQA